MNHYGGSPVVTTRQTTITRVGCIAALAAALLLTASCGSPSSSTGAGSTAAATSQATTSKPAVPAPSEDRSSKSPDATIELDEGQDEPAGLSVSQENALESAQSYLEYSAFSRSGLIDQLKYEGFSKADATFAVDSLDVDWKEQAAKSAESYLEYSSFSRSGLIEQLEYEGFSSAEAEYGAGVAFGGSGSDESDDGGSGGSVSRDNAVESAISYLEYSAFSRSGLIDQLEYEGYSESDATYAVDSLDVDWNEQAAKSAESYLEYSSFSRSGLIDQLMYEGFSASQAEYGVSQVGL